jgi:replication factor A1
LKHVSLKARVTQKSEVRAVESRNGSPLAVCIATLSDGTGEIRLPLWNRQIDTIAKNDTVVIRDATVKNFRGEMQLSLPWKTGTISTVQSTDAMTQ